MYISEPNNLKIHNGWQKMFFKMYTQYKQRWAKSSYVDDFKIKIKSPK